MTDRAAPRLRNRLRRMALLWQLRGVPRCSQGGMGPSVEPIPHCWRLIWPWQEAMLRNAQPVHLSCYSEPGDE